MMNTPSSSEATGQWRGRRERRVPPGADRNTPDSEILLFAADLPTVINWPGRYRLAEDATIVSAGEPAISIEASNVTLNLGGHTLSGTGGGAVAGIAAGRDCRGPVTIRNGRLRRWGSEGVRLVGVRGCRVEAIVAEGNGGRGIAVDADAAVVGCTTIANADR
ncbi:MAG: hypothetical protein ACKVW3_10215 [Phycisphaerales bacterium]